jgi:hypothetical protein
VTKVVGFAHNVVSIWNQTVTLEAFMSQISKKKEGKQIHLEFTGYMESTEPALTLRGIRAWARSVGAQLKSHINLQPSDPNVIQRWMFGSDKRQPLLVLCVTLGSFFEKFGGRLHEAQEEARTLQVVKDSGILNKLKQANKTYQPHFLQGMARTMAKANVNSRAMAICAQGTTNQVISNKHLPTLPCPTTYDMGRDAYARVLWERALQLLEKVPHFGFTMDNSKGRCYVRVQFFKFDTSKDRTLRDALGMRY